MTSFYFTYYIYPLFQLAIMVFEAIMVVILIKIIRQDFINTNKMLKAIKNEIVKNGKDKQ